MPVHVTRPEGSRPAPLVVIYMDSLGIRDVLHDHARRLTEAGYATALPDLFFDVPLDGLPRIGRLAAGDQEEFRRMGELVASRDDQAILEDTSLIVAAVEADGPWGCVGFCMGGRFGLCAAETFGDDVAAASLLHPSRLVTDEPDSPHLAVDRIEGALYLGLGENDHVTPPDTLAPLRERLESNHVAHRIDVLAGADHGFTMPGMPAYNEPAAEHAWSGTLDLLGKRLR
jgi:carboxymethylenebutenolidase